MGVIVLFSFLPPLRNHRQRAVRFLRPGGRDRVRAPNLRQGYRLRVLQKGRFHCQGAQAQPAAAERPAAAHFQGILVFTLLFLFFFFGVLLSAIEKLNRG